MFIRAFIMIFLAVSCKSVTMSPNEGMSQSKPDTGPDHASDEHLALDASTVTSSFTALTHKFAFGQTHILGDEADSVEHYQHDFRTTIDDAQVLRAYLLSGVRDAWNDGAKGAYPLLAQDSAAAMTEVYEYTLSVWFHKVHDHDAKEERLFRVEWDLDSEGAPDLVRTWLLLSSPVAPLSLQRKSFFQGMRMRRSAAGFVEFGSSSQRGDPLTVRRCFNPGRGDAVPYGSLVAFAATGGQTADDNDLLGASGFGIKVGELPSPAAGLSKPGPVVVGTCKDGCERLKRFVGDLASEKQKDGGEVMIAQLTVSARLKPFVPTLKFPKECGNTPAKTTELQP